MNVGIVCCNTARSYSLPVSIYTPTYLYPHLYIHLYSPVSIHTKSTYSSILSPHSILYIHMSTHSHMRPPTHPCTHPSTRPLINHPSIHPPTHPPQYLSTHLSTHLSTNPSTVILCSHTMHSSSKATLPRTIPAVADIPDEANLPSKLLLNLCFLTGVLTFAVVLGVVADEIHGVVASMDEGRIAVAEHNHTVVLHYNEQTGPLLRQVRNGASCTHICFHTGGVDWLRMR